MYGYVYKHKHKQKCKCIYICIYIYIICICVYAGETTDTFRGFLYFALIFFGYLLSKHPEYHGQLWFLVAHHSMFGDFGEPMT